jgi:hypothetical protein
LLSRVCSRCPIGLPGPTVDGFGTPEPTGLLSCSGLATVPVPGTTAPVPGSDRRNRRHDRSRSDLAGMSKADLSRLISALEDEMRAARAHLRFEYAAGSGDEVADLKKELEALADMGVPVK